mgnify:CR=1 FL=1
MMCLVLSVMAFAQTGVDFQHLTFDEALAKAKAEKKLVFVDCYTTWCGPCKMMTTKIFPMKEAGEFFNPRFVCVKFDMEQGEGKELKNKLGVRAYPSFFIIRPDGTVQHAVVGGGELEPFIERVKKGLNEKTSLLYLNQQYEKGKMNKKQLLAYKVALDDAYDQKKAEQVKKELLSQVTEKDKLKKEFWPLFEDGTCTVGTPDFNLILANIPTFEKNIGKEKLDEASELTRSGEMESQDTSTETEKKDAVNINETDFGISQPQPEKLEDSNLEIFEDTETMEAVPDISETSDHQEAEVVQEVQTETPQESSQESYQEAQTEARRKDSQESTWEVRKEALPDSPPDHQEAFQPGSQNQKQPQPDSSKEFSKEDPAESLWNRLRAAYPKVTAFECADGCEILVIKPQDIGLLPRENWVYGNNSFLLHGYYNYRYLILARLGKPGERGRYILGVPGHYGNNEKYMAAMFGFDRFVRSTRQPPRDSRFGYWYTDLNFT